MEGVHFFASLIQFDRVDKGTTMRKGPLLCLNSMMYARRARVWMVFPEGDMRAGEGEGRGGKRGCVYVVG
jgi:hypothetical protein